MQYDVARQALISRIIEASAEGINVYLLVSGRDTPELVQNPTSSDGVLSFASQDGLTVRLLESAIIGITEQPK